MHLILLCAIDTHAGVSLSLLFLHLIQSLTFVVLNCSSKQNISVVRQTNCFFFTSKGKYSVSKTGVLCYKVSPRELSVENIVSVTVELSPCCRKWVLKWTGLLLIESSINEFCVTQMKTLLKDGFNSKRVKVWFEFITFVSSTTCSVFRDAFQYK